MQIKTTINNKMELTNWHDWSKLTIEFDVDWNTNDMITVFKTMAKFLTFSDKFIEYDDNVN